MPAWSARSVSGNLLRRLAELIGLRMQDLEERLATVTGKGEKTQTVVFDQACLEDLERWMEVRARWATCDNFFVAIHGGPLLPWNVWAILKDTACGPACRRRSGLTYSGTRP